jgi:hypothetical protein
MRRCILHVGMHKTGTSSIQHSLAGFADANFVFYSDHRGRTNHNGAIMELVGKPGSYDERRRRWNSRSGNKKALKSAADDVRRSLDDAIRSLGERALIISGEGMLLLPVDQLRELAAFLRSKGIEQIEAVAYVRPLAQYVTSIARAMRGGSLKRVNIQRRSSNYQKQFEKLDAVFGRGNVHLWKFDSGSFPDGCVVQDFCAKVGLNFPVERIVRVNESIPREAVALLYTYRRFGGESEAKSLSPVQRARLLERLGELGETKFRFSPDVLRPMLEHNRADIEWMERRLGESLHEELGEHQPGDVREEWDLLRPNPDVVAKLRDMLGNAAPAGVNGTTPEDVAMLVHALREKVESERVRRSKTRWRRAARPDNAEVRIGDPTEKVGQANSGAANAMPRQNAEALMRNVVRRVNATLRRMQQGIVTHARFGSSLSAKLKGGGSETNAPRSRTGFRPAEQGRVKR